MYLPQDIGSRTDILESAAGTACDDTLIYNELAVLYFILQSKSTAPSRLTFARFSVSSRISIRFAFSSSMV